MTVEISHTQPHPLPTARQVGSASPSPQASATPVSASSPLPEIAPLSNNTTAYVHLRTASDDRQRTALTVRQADTSLARGEEQSSRLKANLAEVLKQFPPYPDNSARSQYLNTLKLLRSELDALKPSPGNPPQQADRADLAVSTARLAASISPLSEGEAYLESIQGRGRIATSTPASIASDQHRFMKLFADT